ncbi:MFS transporter [Microbacterium sp. MPKO10]|uniref:MFS transporter n=1 Tax=Microbacterium sp. MPKO10 TaxID=2989818 RepID=UPI002236A164|nr:MFS transporter [Microbacterium sp. MPKO10]MCW4457164.1 MFS transporter [Microbacterium sp. MPKO10]
MSFSHSASVTAKGSRPPRRGLAMAGLAAAMFVVILDVSMVNLAGPTIRAGLGLSSTELSIVVDSYLVAFAGLLLLGGRIADVLGGRRVFLTGLLVYIAASLLCALAPSGEFLIAGRVIQGVGAAIITPSALSLVVGLYPDGKERAKALGIWGAVAGAGSLLGVVLGGVVTQILGWQSVFWIPVPITVIVGAIVLLSVPATRPRPGTFDFPGAITITLGISALALGMISAPENGWDSPLTLAGLALGAALLATFVIIEKKSRGPLVPLGLLQKSNVVVANSVMLLVGGASVSLFFFLPQFQQNDLGMSPALTGLSQLPIAVMIVVASLIAPTIAKLLGPSRAMSVALLVLIGGFLWLALDQTANGFSLSLLGSFVLIGIGIGLTSVYATTTAVRDAVAGESGLLSGLINASRQLGGAIGLAALVGVATTNATADGAIDFTTAFFGLATFALIALGLSFIPTSRQHSEKSARVDTLSR